MITDFVKVICVSKECYGLNYNKTYYAYFLDKFLFGIFDLNQKYIGRYRKTNFITLEEFREQRLVKILNSHVVGK